MSNSNLHKWLFAFLPLFLVAQEEPLLLSETTEERVVETTLEENGETIALGEPFQAPSISSTLSEMALPAPPALKPTKSPTIAVLLSSLFPGLGHYYLGENRVATTLLSSSVALVGGVYTAARMHDISLTGTSLFTLQAVGSYSLYAAYRDALVYNGNPPIYLPRDDFKQLTAAPFRWSILKKPEVWGGYLGSLAAGIATLYFAYGSQPAAILSTTYIEPLSALPIAISEESLFRGLLQTTLNEKLPPWGAITLSSIAFGAAHIPNAQKLNPSRRMRYYTCSLPLITVLGAYMGWMTHKNHSLQESVALHAWYDFTLIGLGVLASKAAMTEQTDMVYSFEF